MRGIAMNRITGGVGIVVVWLLLFGEVSVANLVGGVAVAAVALALFPRRGAPARHRLSLWGCAVLLAHLAVQLVVSSVQVALAVIVRSPARLRTMVVCVPLRMDSELVATVVADLITLTPGTLTLDVRQNPPRLFVHALGAADRAEVVASVHQLEDRVLRAIRPVGGVPA